MPRGRQGFAVRQMHRFCGAPGTVAQWRPSRTVHPGQYAPTRHVVLAAPRQCPRQWPRQCPRQIPPAVPPAVSPAVSPAAVSPAVCATP